MVEEVPAERWESIFVQGGRWGKARDAGGMEESFTQTDWMERGGLAVCTNDKFHGGKREVVFVSFFTSRLEAPSIHDRTGWGRDREGSVLDY